MPEEPVFSNISCKVNNEIVLVANIIQFSFIQQIPFDKYRLYIILPELFYEAFPQKAVLPGNEILHVVLLSTKLGRHPAPLRAKPCRHVTTSDIAPL